MNLIKILILGLICLLVFTFGCKKLPTSPDILGAISLKINYFTATPEGILPRKSSTLVWSVSNASYIKLEREHDWVEEVETVGTKDVGAGTYILTASSETNSVFKTVIVTALAYVELVRDSVWCGRDFYCEGDEVLQVVGKIENVGGKTAYSVMVKVILFDPDGNFLVEEYASLYEMYSYENFGTVADLPQNEYFTFVCKWLIKENLEMVEQFDSTHNPYRPDKNLEKTIIITWND